MDMEEIKPTQMTEEEKKFVDEAQMKDRLASEEEAHRSEPKEEESEPTQTKDEKEAKDKKSNKPEPSRACSWCGILCMASLVCFLVSAICVVWSL